MKNLNYIKSLILFIFSLLFSLNLYAQSNGTVLIVVSSDSKILIDGAEVGKAEKDKPVKFEVSAGEHYVQAITISNKGQTALDQIITIEAQKQKVVKFDILVKDEQKVENESSTEAILVADLGMTIQGIMAVSAWKSQNDNKEYPNYPNYYYAFERGDIIVIDFKMTNAKGTNSLTVSTFPDHEVKYTNTNFAELNSVRIVVENKSIYHFSLSTNHAFNRDCRMVIKRIPATVGTRAFNPNVARKTKYIAKEVQSNQHYFINSGSHVGGKTRELLQVSLPNNTVHWYYRVSAWRSDKQLEQDSKNFKLVSEVSKLIDQTGGISFALSEMTKPPCADYCDVYLLDETNSGLFIKKADPYNYTIEGTRENFNSGIVQVKVNPSGTCFLGIKNPSQFYGINVEIEVVAVVKQQYLEMEN